MTMIRARCLIRTLTQGRALPAFAEGAYQEIPAPPPTRSEDANRSSHWSNLSEDGDHGQLTPGQIMDNEIVKRREKEYRADVLYKQARAAFRKKDYAVAVRHIERAQVLLLEASRSEPRVLNKIDA